jgi:hypothetical protein
VIEPSPRRARDLALLDAIDALPREPFAGPVWRVVRQGRDPLQGGRSFSRWCNNEFDVLYTSLDRDGAVAEIHALLSLQPVFPSKLRFHMHRLTIAARHTLRIADTGLLARLGVNLPEYRQRTYSRSQEIADAAYFLGFDGLIAPSARWTCLNLVVFTERIESEAMNLQQTESAAVDWRKWRSKTASPSGNIP